MKHRTVKEVAEFFGVKMNNVHVSEHVSLDDLMVLTYTVAVDRTTVDHAVQTKRHSNRRDKAGKGKGSSMFHGGPVKSGGART